MTIHEAFLELAATSIDFDLDDEVRAELDRHIAGCEACRRTVARYRDDAAEIGSLVGPSLTPARSVAILASVLQPPKAPVRLAPVGALLAILVVGVVVAAFGLNASRSPGLAVVPDASGSPDPGASVGPTVVPSAPSATPRTPVSTPQQGAGALPVRASGEELGRSIRMAPTTGGDLYVAVPAPGGAVLTRLDAAGRPRSGWPLVLAGTTACDQLLPAADGSVRLVCTLENAGGDMFSPIGAFAFDPDGGMLAGWPRRLGDHGAHGYFAARASGVDLTIYAWASRGDQIEEGEPAGDAWIMSVAHDGTVSNGTKVPFGSGCCNDTWAIGPDGVAYGTVHRFGEVGGTSSLAAVSASGIASGFPIAIEGIASGPAFDDAGLIHVTVGSADEDTATLFVFDRNGRAIGTRSAEVGIAATSAGAGTGDSHPAAPTIGRDGTVFVIDTTRGTAVAVLDPSGEHLAGWPYRSELGLQDIGSCGAGDTGCASSRAAPVVGRDNVLYLLNQAARANTGGRIVSIGPDGRVVRGWPVDLTRTGSEFWSIVVGSDGTSYALAVEPEPNGSHSATILSLAPDSTVLYTVTVVEP